MKVLNLLTGSKLNLSSYSSAVRTKINLKRCHKYINQSKVMTNFFYLAMIIIF